VPTSTSAPRAPGPAPGSLADQLARFGSIGVVSTVVFGLLLAVLVGPLGGVAATGRLSDAARVVVVTLAGALSALIRFVLLRRWVFR
jgi:putative flippase GtrA